MTTIYRDGELYLYGTVGEWWGEYFTASDVVAALAEHGRGKPITAHINSGGGDVFEGIAIYNALVAHGASVRIEVDGLAASIASVIAMSGSDIVMRSGAMMMIHDPAGFTAGTADDHERTRRALEVLAASMVDIYVGQTGEEEGVVREAMKVETWMTADEAVAAGYATEVASSRAAIVAAFDYRLYAHAPRKLVALARKHGWEASPSDTPAAGAAANEGDQPMAETKQAASETATVDADKIRAEAAAEAVKADREFRASVMALPEAEGREALAEQLYLAGLPLDNVKAALAAAPKGAPAESADQDGDDEAYAQARASGAGLGAPDTAKGGDKIGRIVGNYRSMTGAKAPA